MGLAYRFVQRLPITTPLVYLVIGVALGAHGVLPVHPLGHAAWLRRAAEIAVIVSLFSVGLKLRFPILDRKLRPAFMLAFGSRVVTVGLGDRGRAGFRDAARDGAGTGFTACLGPRARLTRRHRAPRCPAPWILFSCCSSESSS